jgi:hypothetical protein
MRSWISLLCGAVLLGGFAAGPVAAGVSIDWDPAYTWEPGATPTNSNPGGVLQGVGIVSSFDVPFQDLNANDPNKEYTFYFHNLVSLGTVTYGSPGLQFYVTDYTGGTFELYEGSPRNSVFAPNPPNAQVPSTYIDGTLILAGSFTRFETQTNDFTANQVGNMEGEINWTGGTLLDRTNRGGQPCPGLFTGGITWRPDVLIPGYIFRHDGKIDLNCPTPADPSSWGRIKAQYR